MRAFVAMRRFLTANAGLFQRVDRLEQQQVLTNERLDLVLDKIEELSPAVTTEQLFSSGCVWDAYTFVCDLVRSAEKRLVLIDNYVDERVLTLLGASVKDMGRGLCTIIKIGFSPEMVLAQLR